MAAPRRQKRSRRPPAAYARPALGRQRTIKNWLGLFGRRSKSEKALASPTSPRSPKTIPRP